MRFVKIARPDIAVTATVPESALQRYQRDGWAVVDESAPTLTAAESVAAPPYPPSQRDAADAENTEG